MSTDREHTHAQHDAVVAPTHDDLSPGLMSRSAKLDAPEKPIASGLIARKATRDDNGVADGADGAVAKAGSSSGSSLPEPIMRKFESSLGADLSGVRVHTGDDSAHAAHATGARAYTMGQDIHFGAGQYDPNSGSGQHLLAHEVAHTVQQGSAPRIQHKLEVSSPHDGAEVEADQAADAMVSGASFSVSMGAGVQRKVFRDAGGPSYARNDPSGKPKSREMVAFEQDYDNTCKDAALKILEGIKTIYDTGKSIDERVKSGELAADPADMLKLAKQVKDTANALHGMKRGVDALKKKKLDFSRTQIVPEPQLPSVISVMKSAKDSITQGFATSEALENFQNNPSRETAKAWADNLGKQFSTAASIVSGLPFPPGCEFIQDYYVGLLSAPTTYINAFSTIASQRYDALDAASGGTNADELLREGDKSVWEGGGPVQRLVGAAWTAPNGHALFNWFTTPKGKPTRRMIQGVDMWANPPFETAKALFIMALGDDTSVEKSRDEWVTWISAFPG